MPFKALPVSVPPDVFLLSAPETSSSFHAQLESSFAFSVVASKLANLLSLLFPISPPRLPCNAIAHCRTVSPVQSCMRLPTWVCVRLEMQPIATESRSASTNGHDAGLSRRSHRGRTRLLSQRLFFTIIKPCNAMDELYGIPPQGLRPTDTNLPCFTTGIENDVRALGRTVAASSTLQSEASCSPPPSLI